MGCGVAAPRSDLKENKVEGDKGTATNRASLAGHFQTGADRQREREVSRLDLVVDLKSTTSAGATLLSSWGLVVGHFSSSTAAPEEYNKGLPRSYDHMIIGVVSCTMTTMTILRRPLVPSFVVFSL